MSQTTKSAHDSDGGDDDHGKDVFSKRRVDSQTAQDEGGEDMDV
jgi:hypothetical protein